MKLVLVLLAFLALTVSVCSSLSYNEEELVYSSGGRLKWSSYSYKLIRFPFSGHKHYGHFEESGLRSTKGVDSSEEEHHYHYIPAPPKRAKPPLRIKTWTKETCPVWTVVKASPEEALKNALIAIFQKAFDIIAGQA